MKIKKLVTIGVTAVVLVGGTAGGIHFYKSYQSKKLVAPVIPVADINWGYWGDSETSYGMVTNNSAQEVYLDDAEDVEKIFVKQGDEVKKGDPLVKYDISEVEADIKHKELELAAQENDIAKETRELEALRQIVPVADPVEHDDEDDVWDEWDTREAQIEKLEEELMNLESLPETDERDSRIYNYVTEDSVPYNVETADGSAERPYIYYCNKDAYAYGSFFNSIRPKKKKDGTMTEGKHVRFIICKKDGKGQMLLKEDVPPQDAVPEIKNDQEQTIDQLEKPSRRPEKEEEKPKKDEEKPKKDKEEAKKENEELKNAQVEKKEKRIVKSSEAPLGNPIPDNSVNPNMREYDGSTIEKSYDDDSMWYIFSGKEIGRELQDLLDQMDAESEWEDEWEDDGDGERYTQKELTEAIYEKETEIKKMDLEKRVMSLQLESLKASASDGIVYAKVDGIVQSTAELEEGASGSEPLVKIVGSEGLFVSGTVSELQLDTVKPGTVITANSWETGMTFDATVTKISDYPVEGSSFGEGNPNVSYYQYTAYIEDSSALKNGEYVDLSLKKDEPEGEGLYIDKAYVRQENGKSYVMIADKDNRLKKQYIMTGKTVYGSAVEVKGGLSEDDMIAFPYGKTAVEGVAVTEDAGEIY